MDGGDDMAVRMYTIATRLEQKGELKEYLESFITGYNKIQRRVYQDIVHGIVSEYPNVSQYVSRICKEYGVLKRTINSIRYDMNGRIKALLALKKTQLKELELKIISIQKEIETQEKKKLLLKPLVTENKADKVQLKKYQKVRKKLYYLKNRCNQWIQRREQLKKVIETKKVTIGFGSRKMFQKQYHLEENGYQSHKNWKKAYEKARDCGIFYLGSGDETCGNQLVQLSYDKNTNSFTMKLRKENHYCNSKKPCDKYLIVDLIRFPYLGKELSLVLQSGKPVTYRIGRKGRKWYLMAIFTLEKEIQTYSKYGVLGMDYNDGFMEVAETNESGNLISMSHIGLKYHGTGKKAKTEIETKLSNVVKTAVRVGKDIVIEDLDFKKKKAKQSKGQTKKEKTYHKMLHLFDYRRYKQTLDNLCKKYGVHLEMVNPAYTSILGEQKYSKDRKLSRHQAAAYVIARRGQGYQDIVAM